MGIHRFLTTLGAATLTIGVVAGLIAYLRKCETNDRKMDRDTVEALNLGTLAKWYLNNSDYIESHPELLHAVINPNVSDPYISKQFNWIYNDKDSQNGYSFLIQCLYDQEQKSIKKVNLIKYKVIENELYEILESGKFFTVGMTIMNQEYD